MKDLDPRKTKRKLERILRGLGYHNCELSLLFTDDHSIAELNRRFLRREGPTNVLAFPMRGGDRSEPETPMLGDIVISLDAARRDAETAGESLISAIDRLSIHGLLHLLGYDHERSEEQAQVMKEETERLLRMME